MKSYLADSIRDVVTVPPLIERIAAACAGDLLYGPKRVWLPDGSPESFDEDNVYSWGDEPDDEDRRADDWYGGLYTSPAADLLRDFIGDLPTLYIDEFGDVHDSEPSSDPDDWTDEDDESGRYIEAPSYNELDRDLVIEALFGRTIAREFR